MPFAWLSDDFYDHPKVRALPRRIRNEAAGMFCRLVSLSNRYLTDGRITEADIETVDGRPVLVNALMTVPPNFDSGLLERRGDELWIHDFGQYSRTRRQVVSDRRKKAAAGRKGGLASGRTRGARGPKRQGKPSRSDTEPEAKHVLHESLNPESLSQSPSHFPSEELASARSSAGARAIEDRDGLPHITATVQRVGEEITGHGILSAKDAQLTELDRLVEDHGEADVVAAFRRVAGDERRSWRQLVWDSVKVLEPFAASTSPRDREQAERDQVLANLRGPSGA